MHNPTHGRLKKNFDFEPENCKLIEYFKRYQENLQTDEDKITVSFARVNW
jgi:hypothetical protein